MHLARTEQIPAANNASITSAFHSGVSSFVVLEPGPFPSTAAILIFKELHSLANADAGVLSDDVNMFLTKLFFLLTLA